VATIAVVAVSARGLAQRLSGASDGGGALFMRGVEFAAAALVLVALLVGVAAPLAAGLSLLSEDLTERAMLGDCGANALGAMLGTAAATLPRPARIALLAGITGLTLASEKVSFTKVIERTPALRWLDMLGRRPPEATPKVRIPAPRGEAANFNGAATTLRSAENTDLAPPEE